MLYTVKRGCYELLTSGGQTPHPISIIFNRLRERTVGTIVTENEEAVLKTVGAGLRTDRHTHTQTHRHTDRHTHRHDRFYYSCPSEMGNYN